MNNLLEINEKEKIKFFIKKYFHKKRYIFKKEIYEVIKKIIIFSKKNLHFISYNYLYFFLNNFNIKYLRKIIFIIKELNIKVYDNIPSKKNYYINLNLNNENYSKKKIDKIQKCTENLFKKNFFKKTNELKKNEDIIKIYKKINNILIKIKNNIINNFFIFKFLILKIKLNNNFEKLKNIFYKKNNLYKKIFKSIIFKKKIKNKLNKNEKNSSKFKKKIFYKFIFFLKKIFTKKKNDKFNTYKKFFKKFNFEKKNKLIFNFNLLDEIYNILYIYNKKIEIVKNKIYDILTNVSKIDWLKFTFYFNKNGTNLNWVFNISNLFKMDSIFIKKYKKFILNQKKKLKEIEKKISIPLRFFIKIFSFIELNKFKIDIIKNDILESNLYLVNYATLKYSKKDLYWDYMQEGILGLIYSINKFNYKYKNFRNFTIFNIKSNINKFYYKSSKLISLPRTLISSIKKINEATNIFLKKYNQKPTIKYLKKKTNLPEKEVIKVLKVFKDPISLEAKINTDDSEETRFIDIVGDKDQINTEEYIFDLQLKKIINNIFKKFDKKHKKIISEIYGINDSRKYSYLEISREHNITKKEILDINNFFLKKIEDPNLLKNMKKFLK